MYQSKCQFRISTAVKVDLDSGRKIYRYVATCAGREISPAMQAQWNECIIGNSIWMAGVSTAQAEFLLPIMEAGWWKGLILTEIFYGQTTGLLPFINWQELFFTHYSFHGLFVGKVTEEWMALQCVLYRMRAVTSCPIIFSDFGATPKINQLLSVLRNGHFEWFPLLTRR